MLPINKTFYYNPNLKMPIQCGSKTFNRGLKTVSGRPFQLGTSLDANQWLQTSSPERKPLILKLCLRLQGSELKNHKININKTINSFKGARTKSKQRKRANRDQK